MAKSSLLKRLEVWFVTGSQHLYGPGPLEQVATHSKEIAKALGDSASIPVKVVFKPVVKTPDEIASLFEDANRSRNCIGVMTWMHTFSPSKMWIRGLNLCRKPLAHLHTQYNRQIPWPSIDMDFMNLNQAAHGDREHGFIMSRMRLNRKVIVGHWQDPEVQQRIGTWARAAAAWADWQGARFARFGDNMRQVAVTEGDKVAAETVFGFAVNGFGVGDLVQRVNAVPQTEINRLVKEYEEEYQLSPELRNKGKKRESLIDGARIELGMRAFLQEGGFSGFTTTFEDLHGLKQLPGLAVQRLMSDGFGFGAEGDWKTAALLRAMKVMSSGLPGGTSFMEDYTYHFDDDGDQVLGAHMLEICPSIASTKPSLEIHPLGIGGKADPVRLVFDTPAGPAINSCLLDMGTRFRLVTNEVDVVPPPEPLPRLPVARALWSPQPDLNVSATCWIYAGGAHHTGFSQAIGAEHMEDFAEIAGIEHLLIGNSTRVPDFKAQLRANEVYYGLKTGFRS